MDIDLYMGELYIYQEKMQKIIEDKIGLGYDEKTENRLSEINDMLNRLSYLISTLDELPFESVYDR